MIKLNKDLGRTSTELYGGSCCSAPCKSESDKKPIYPNFRYNGDEELEIPKRGIMTIEYSIRSSSEKEDSDGKERHECGIDVLKIVSVEGDAKAPARSGSETADALDALAKEVREKHEESD